MDSKTTEKIQKINEIGEQLEVSETKCENLKAQLTKMKNLYNRGIFSESIDTRSDHYFGEDFFYPMTRSDYEFSSPSKDFQEFLNQQNSHVRNFRNEINKLHFQIEETIAESGRTNSKKSLKSSASRGFELENQKDAEKNINSNFELNSPRTFVFSDSKKNEILRNEDNNISKISFDWDFNPENKISEESTKSIEIGDKNVNDKTEIGETEMKIEIKIKDECKIKNLVEFQDESRTINQKIEITEKFPTTQEIKIKDENQMNEKSPKLPKNKLSPKIKISPKNQISKNQKSTKNQITDKIHMKNNDNNSNDNKIRDELFLKFCQSIESVEKIVTSKLNNKSEKKFLKNGKKSLPSKLSSAIINESVTTIGKIKKKKGKLRSISSKSTIATKRESTNLIGAKKERKRRKEKIRKNDLARSSSLQNPNGKIEENLNDLVEIYHNMSLKTGSVSIVSSKHSRMNPHFHEESVHEISPRNVQKVEFREKTETRPKKKLSLVDIFSKEKSTSERPKEENIPGNNEMKFLHSYPENKFYDPILMRNYEQPTVASKLKRVQRSYYNRFNFRNIPFTTGTSISPSHNLGLNIQQVLGIMKSKQARPQGTSSMLIRKMSQGNRPVTFSNEMSSQLGLNFENLRLKNSALNCKTSQTSALNRTGNSQAKISALPNFNRNVCETLFEDKEMELNIEKKNPLISQSNNEKGNRDVLIKLHDQFEAMNLKYEKLQEKSAKSKDKSLTKEIQSLEVDLTAKEEEINAVVGLYKEVMSLKKQMKRMSEKNSFVCMSSESSNVNPIINYAHNPTIRAFFSPHLQINKSHGSDFGNIREPSTGTRLTGLLRQIQMFQRQLKQASLS